MKIPLKVASTSNRAIISAALTAKSLTGILVCFQRVDAGAHRVYVLYLREKTIVRGAR